MKFDKEKYSNMVESKMNNVKRGIIMSDFEIKGKIKNISSLIFNIIIQNKIVAYEEYRYFSEDDSSIQEFEKAQLEKYKDTIDKWINDSEIDRKLEEFILLEKDPYGLQMNKINLINDINDSFFELEREMLIDCSEIRDKWKNIIFEKYTKEIEQLKLDLEKSNESKAKIEFKLEQSESEKAKIEDNLILCEKDKVKFRELSEKYKSEKEQLNKVLVIKNKEIITISDEKQILDDEIKKLTFKYKQIEKELEVMKSGNVKSAVTEKEIEHYKKLLNSAKEIKIKSDKEIDEYKSMINTLNDDLNNLNREVNNKDNIISRINEQIKVQENQLSHKEIIIRDKDKEIEELKKKLMQRIQEVKSTRVKVKMSLEEFKAKSNKVVVETQNILRSILSKEKNIEEESTANICREPYGILNALRSCQSVDLGVELISKVIPLLIEIDKKCKRNGLDYNLESEIEKLYELKEKNI